MTPRLLSATSIEGTPVKNSAGEHIGEIKELMIDWRSGTVAYAALSFGGILGFGAKLFAIPVEAFNFDVDDPDEGIILDISKAQLEKAPGFDHDNWPEQPNYDFIDSVHVYYGYKPFSNRYSKLAPGD
ncbi:PRC-barrel domain containing protein [Fulvivirga sp. M361]|uniref:PRC-barrel domain-containing protein n=1 Tax=Fulvivirga sp. M361 TaxID=2594266 RepID=UPI00117ACB1C|nr:PRC-barrel domain-containing protein [Fulvivirga sp. M361]TRX60518.1 PRC-barrel domain containing protein [Fulvivirga sp. M361]